MEETRAGLKRFSWILGLVLLWLVTILEVLSMFTAGWGKFEHASGWRIWFDKWGYGAWFSPVIGVAEMAGAVLLPIPRIASYAAAFLIAIMLGAFFTVTTKETDLSWFDPLLHILFLAIILAGRWKRRWRGVVG